MAYTKNNWSDRQVQKPMTFNMVTNADGTITLQPSEGTIIQSGTPITADKMNNLEMQYDQAILYAEAAYAKKQQGQWAYAATENGWGNLDSATYGVASYMKDEFGFVHFIGVLSGGVTTDGTTIFTLPSGYRPLYTRIFAADSNNGTSEVIARIHVLPDGRVQVYKAGLNHLSINGIYFMTA
jgi:hypothetical protein